MPAMGDAQLRIGRRLRKSLDLTSRQLANSWAGEELDMIVVILGAITKAAVAVVGLVVGLLVAQYELSRRRAQHRLLRQAVPAPSEFLEPRRINTRRMINSPSRAPPRVISNRHRGTPGSFGRV